MMYYSQQARHSAMDRIQELCAKVAEIPGNVLNYNDATAIVNYLSDYRKEIEKEYKHDQQEYKD